MKSILLITLMFLFSTAIWAQTIYYPTDSLKAYYPMDGNLKDFSGNDRTGYGNANVSMDRFGNYYSAYEFDNSSSLYIPNSSLNFGEDFTITYWIKPYGANYSNTDYQTIIDLTPKLNLKLSWNEDQEFCRPTLVSGSSVPSTTLKNVWTHITYTYSNDTLSLFVNGKLLVQNSVSINSSYANANFSLGGDVSPSNLKFNGALDELMLYNRALSSEEISQIANYNPFQFQNSGGTGGVWSIGSNNSINYKAGNVGIGTYSPDEKLTVKGKIHAEEIIVDLNIPQPDYVFEKDYNLIPLHQLENFINSNKHLPEIPSAEEVQKNGITLGEMQTKLLLKVEELTLYTIKQQKQIEELALQNKSLLNRVKKIK